MSTMVVTAEHDDVACREQVAKWFDYKALVFSDFIIVREVQQIEKLR